MKNFSSNSSARPLFLCIAFLLAGAFILKAQNYTVSNPVGLYGWLDQHSLDTANSFIGNEACVPTSMVNALTYLQNFNPALFGTNLTGGTNISSTQGTPNSYANWVSTDQTLIGLDGTQVAAGGTSYKNGALGAKVYLLRTGYYSDITVNYTNVSIPALTNALSLGDAVLGSIQYTNNSAGHCILLNGLTWNSASNNWTLYFVDPLDPSQNYSGSNVLGPVLQTLGTLTNTSTKPSTNQLLLQYSQLEGNNLIPPYATNYHVASAYLDNLTILSVHPDTNTNAAWSNLIIGSDSLAQTNIITNRITNVYSNTTIGYASNSSNNLLIVANSWTLLSNSVNLYVGNSGAENSLVISNEAVVAGEYGVIGNYVTASSNTVLVTGSGSIWTNAGDLAVGFDGSGNSLVITNGGAVLGGTDGVGGIIGADIGSSNNSVLVTGVASTWSNSLDLYVGFAGNNNSLVISSEAVVSDVNGTIGNYYLSSNNSVLVTDAGTLWTNGGYLYVGNSGSGNSLVILNGGVVADAWSFIGGLRKDFSVKLVKVVESRWGSC